MGILCSCASIVAPSGGKKDEKPPVLVKVVPEQHTVNFNSKKVVFEFDEYIQLVDKDKQLVISPIMKPAPQMEVRGKKLTITFNNDLKPNTTYTINFGKAVADLHESNAMNDFSYVFSTGSFIDSLTLKGKVVFAENLKTEKGILVMLYSSLNDSAPYNSMPDYYTRTNENGQFLIQNIAKGPFRLFALKDVDNNYRYNADEEFAGFVEKPVMGGDAEPLNIKLFKQKEQKVYIKESGLINAKEIRMILSGRPQTKLSTEVLNNPKVKILQTIASSYQDTVWLWLNDTLPDTLHLKVSDGMAIHDTLSIAPSRKFAGKLNQSISLISGAKMFPADSIVIACQVPVKSFNSEKLILKRDSISIITPTSSTYRPENQQIVIKAPFTEKNKWSVVFLREALIDIYNQPNDTLKLNFATAAYTDYGSLKVNLSGLLSGNYLLQLVDEKDVVLAEKKINSGGTYLFEGLLPAKCRLRLIFDQDNNGSFTSGNYLLGRLPESVWYNDEVITIRANWDIETNWNIKLNEK
jgi:hypothetical protein